MTYCWHCNTNLDEVKDLRVMIADLRNQVERARKGIQDYLDGNYDNPRQHRPDKCTHGQYWYEGCQTCDDIYFTKLIVALSSTAREGGN